MQLLMLLHYDFSNINNSQRKREMGFGEFHLFFISANDDCNLFFKISWESYNNIQTVEYLLTLTNKKQILCFCFNQVDNESKYNRYTLQTSILKHN